VKFAEFWGRWLGLGFNEEGGEKGLGTYRLDSCPVVMPSATRRGIELRLLLPLRPCKGRVRRFGISVCRVDRPWSGAGLEAGS
jgi:hypothetical protein